MLRRRFVIAGPPILEAILPPPKSFFANLEFVPVRPGRGFACAMAEKTPASERGGLQQNGDNKIRMQSGEFVRIGDDWWGEEAEHQPGPLFFKLPSSSPARPSSLSESLRAIRTIW